MQAASKPYFPFIDLVKGAAIFGVMMIHTRGEIFNTREGAFFSLLITACYMSLFFMASGFVSASVWTRRVELRDLLAWKNYSLLVPFLLVGTAMCAWRDFTAHSAFTVNPLVMLFTDEYNGGLWFLLVLSQFRLALLLGRYLCTRVLRLPPISPAASFRRQIPAITANLFLMTVIGGGAGVSI